MYQEFDVDEVREIIAKELGVKCDDIMFEVGTEDGYFTGISVDMGRYSPKKNKE